MSDKEQMDGGTLETLSAEEVRPLYDRGEIVLIDVRTPAEYAFERINGALLFPMSSFDAKRLPDPGGKPIVFHCGSGVRSQRVAQACLAAGWTHIRHMAGGLAAWKGLGYPHIATDMASGAPVERGA